MCDCFFFYISHGQPHVVFEALIASSRGWMLLWKEPKTVSTTLCSTKHCNIIALVFMLVTASVFETAQAKAEASSKSRELCFAVTKSETSDTPQG